MKKPIFALCDPEAEYASNFMEYLNRKKSLPFEVRVFTGAESLLAFARENRIELLLIAAEAMCREIRELEAGKIILLTEGSLPPELDSYAGVYKYQSSAQVVREVMACYGEEKAAPQPLAPVLKKKTEILGVYSPVGRCRKTSFALTLGQLLSVNCPVLYVNMEEYSGFEELLGHGFSGSLSDLLYYMRQENRNLTVKIGSMVQTVGQLDFIPPVQSPADIRGTPWQDWISLIQEIVLHTSYEVLILDIGNGIDEVFQILDMCSRIYTPVRSDRMSRCKLAQFDRYIQALEQPQLLTKMVRMKLPLQENCSGRDISVEQLPFSELGVYVRQMLRKEET